MTDDDPAALRRRLERERAARREAEQITERVTGELYRSADELRRTNDELQALNDALREFVAIASHDLRGPLTGILGMSSLLLRRRDELSAEQRMECLTTIDRQGRLLDRLINDLLTVSRIEAGAVTAEPQVVALDRAVEQVVTDTPGMQGAVSSRIGERRVIVDPEHLRRILGNYLANALTYGEAPVHVDARDAGPAVEVLVCDAGEGVAPELLPRLFGKFARGAASASKGGTGLGLSIVQGLARVNGGDTWYEPNHPRGACFGLRLPRA